MHYRILFLIILGLSVGGCSTKLRFNDSFSSAEWKTVMVAPFKGKFGDSAETQFIHEFGTNTQFKIILPEVVSSMISEQKLVEQYKRAPITTLIKIAQTLGADGFVYGKVDIDFDAYTTIAKIDMKLIESKTGTIVSSNLEESSSLIADEEAIVESAMNSVVGDFRKVFKRISPSFDG